MLARRRLRAALCAGLAVLFAVRAHAAPAPPRTTVLVAAHDLPAAARVGPGDLTRRAFPSEDVPAGVVTAGQAVGRLTVGPVRAGEPLTDARLLGASLLRGYPGAVAIPVRLGDPGAAALLRVGDRVDLLAADPQGRSPARLVTSQAPVLALPHVAAGGTDLVSGALVVVAVPPETARDLAAAAVTSFLSVTIGH